MRNETKIDFVIPWVDANDKKWIESYNNTFADRKIDKNRYTDMGLLKYWFRAIEKNAPWINKIHFITEGHLPEFLNINHPKINIVRHEDYIPKKYLPTFSSNPIEINMHRIEGLAEQFVYFNDDTYLINSVEPGFFFKNGLPKHIGVLRPIVSPNYYHISEIQQNNNGVINQNFEFKKSLRKNKKKWLSFKYGLYNFSNLAFSVFNHSVGFYEDHMPNSILKSTIKEIWEKEYEIMDNTSINKLRNIKVDVNQWLFKQWQLMSGSFYPKPLNQSKLFSIYNIEDAKKVKVIFGNNNIKMICINDHVKDENEYEKISSILDSIFIKKFPEKSNFEK